MACSTPPCLSDESRRALLALLADSLQRGHYRVACSRYLKLVAGNSHVPEPWAASCRRLLQQLPTRERLRMHANAQAWASLVRGRAPVVADAAPSYQTHWRPFPRAFRAPAPKGPTS